jgi:hypothetical protein
MGFREDAGLQTASASERVAATEESDSHTSTSWASSLSEVAFKVSSSAIPSQKHINGHVTTLTRFPNLA